MKENIVVGAVCLGLGWGSIGLCGTAKMPNIILVMSDDQGWGQVGYMGHPHLKGRTPHMDAMAESGIRFNRFYAAAPVCSPTRAASASSSERDPGSSSRNVPEAAWTKPLPARAIACRRSSELSAVTRNTAASPRAARTARARSARRPG